jgi:hypothetical protein
VLPQPWLGAVFRLKVRVPRFFAPSIIVLSHYVTVIRPTGATVSEWSGASVCRVRSGSARILKVDVAHFSKTPVPAYQTVIPLFLWSKILNSL